MAGGAVQFALPFDAPEKLLCPPIVHSDLPPPIRLNGLSGGIRSTTVSSGLPTHGLE